MSEVSAERLIQLNRQAMAMLRMGIPLDLGLEPAAEVRLREINDELLGGLRDPNWIDHLLQNPAASERYVAVARLLLAADDPTPIFQSIANTQLDRQASAALLQRVFAEPLFVAFLAYCGLILFCAFSVPSIERQYADQELPIDGWADLLFWLRSVMPYWVVGVPIILLLMRWGWRTMARGGAASFLSGSTSYRRWLAAESQAISLSELSQSGVEQETAIRLVDQATAGGIPVNKMTEHVVRDVSVERRGRVMDRLAHFYRFLAEDRRRMLFTNLPTWVGGLIAAGVVLMYGLAVFVPWIEILSTVGQAGGVR